MTLKYPTYPFEIVPLSEEDGQGYLISFPDLPGCLSEGAAIEEAICNGADAQKASLRAPGRKG